MTESLVPSPDAKPAAEETLRLKCDQCGGGLVLKRRHLGIKGQCVHCQVPLMAIEEDGVIRVVSERPVFAPEPAVSAPEPVPVETLAAQVETEAPAVAGSWSLADFGEPAAPAVASEEPVPMDMVPAPAADTSMFGFGAVAGAGASTAISWDLADFGRPAAAVADQVVKEPTAPVVPELQPPLPTRDGDNLFGGKPDNLLAPDGVAPASAEASPFGQSSGGFSIGVPSFLGNDDAAPVNAAWGTNVPKEAHASISPFGTGSAGGGFAESLFREKVEKENASHHTVAMSAFAPVSPTPEAVPATPAAPHRDCEEKVILDGDGRPMRPMTKEEEEDFAKNFFKYENARSTPRWVKRLRKMAIRSLVIFCLIGGAGGGVAAFTPKEQLVEWKTKAINWLEPGMAILDYLPEKWRPKWLPESKFGIDGGVGEDGKPKKKMNAFEGLDKLKGDIGNMRGSADDELKKLNQM